MTPAEKREALAAWYELQERDGVREDPPGSNDGEPVRRYALPKETPAPWCSRMARTGLLLVDAFEGIPSPSISDVYFMGAAAFLHDWLLRYGQLVGSPDLPVQRGDLCFHVDPSRKIPIHHVSCVVDAGRGVAMGLLSLSDVVTTIDGNWGDAVERGLILCATPSTSYRFVRFPIGAPS